MIQVMDGYRVREGVIIAKGFYEDDAPELHGQRDYLIANGHARIAEPGEAVVDSKPDADALPVDGYDGNLLKVHQGYRVREGHIINPGLYVPDDPVLDGRGQYLVDNGYAMVIVREPAPEPEPEPAEKPLGKMTVAELKAKAESLGASVPEGIVKADLLTMVEGLIKGIAEATAPKE